MADDRTGRAAEPAGQDALELLRQDHREVERLFGQYPRATVAQKDTFFEGIKHELDAHAAVEEELFYPALKAEGGELAALVERAVLEHSGLETLMAAIEGMQPDDPRYDAAVGDLADDVRKHVGEEEGQIFPMAQQCLGAERLRDLGERMAARKTALREEMADLAP
ncbi:MAG: hemerythrin [Acidobacteria bacterium]|nr:MAG: hemerythrin [Acidobacteriota bacterium]